MGLLDDGARSRLVSVLMFVGMMCWWPFLRNSITGVLLAAADDMLSLGLFLVAAIAFSLLAGLSSPLLRLLIHRPKFLLGVAVALALCSCLSGLLMRNAGMLVVRPAIACLFALLYILLPVAWWSAGQRLFKNDAKGFMLMALSSYTASLFVGLLVYVFDSFSLIRACVFPFASTVCWFGVHSMVSRGGRIDCEGPQARENVGVKAKGLRWPKTFYAVLLFLFLMACVLVGFIKTGSLEYVPSSMTLVRDILNVVVGALLSIIVVRCGASGRSGVILATGVSLMMLFGVVVASVAREQAFGIGAGLIAVAESCYSVLLFAACGAIACKKEKPGVVVWGFALPCIANVWLGAVLVPYVVDAFGMSYFGFWGILSVSLGLLLGIVLLLFLSGLVVRGLSASPSPSGGIEVSDGETRPGPAGSVDAVERARDMYGLTGREVDVLRLLLGGNTLRKIPEILDISEGTVQSHTKALYRKTGVHTKQELIDLMTEIRSGKQASGE